MEPKERILHKARELFLRYGIRSVSMDDIAVQLGVSKKTLYHYYTDKDELVNAVFDISLEENRSSCTRCEHAGDNAVHSVFLSFEMVREMASNMNPSIIFDLQKYHPSAFKKYASFKNEFLFNIIQSNLKRGVDEGLYREDIDVNVLSRFRIACVMMSFNPEIFPDNWPDIAHTEGQLFEHFLYGLVTPKGYKLIEKYKAQRQKQTSK